MKFRKPIIKPKYVFNKLINLLSIYRYKVFSQIQLAFKNTKKIMEEIKYLHCQKMILKNKILQERFKTFLEEWSTLNKDKN